MAENRNPSKKISFVEQFYKPEAVQSEMAKTFLNVTKELSDKKAMALKKTIAPFEKQVEGTLISSSGEKQSLVELYYNQIAEIYYGSAEASTDIIKRELLPTLEDISSSLRSEIALSDEEKDPLLKIIGEAQDALKSRISVIGRVAAKTKALAGSGVVQSFLAGAATDNPLVALAVFAASNRPNKKKTVEIEESRRQASMERGKKSFAALDEATAPTATKEGRAGTRPSAKALSSSAGGDGGFDLGDGEGGGGGIAGILAKQTTTLESIDASMKGMVELFSKQFDLQQRQAEESTFETSSAVKMTKEKTDDGKEEKKQKGFLETLLGGFVGVADFIKGLLPNWMTELGGKFFEMISTLGGTLSTALSSLGSTLSGAFSALKGGLSSLLSNILPAGAGAAAAFLGGGLAGVAATAATFKAISAGPALVGSVYKKAKEYGLDQTGSVTEISKRIRAYEQSKGMTLSKQARVINEGGKPVLLEEGDPRLTAAPAAAPEKAASSAAPTSTGTPSSPPPAPPAPTPSAAPAAAPTPPAPPPPSATPTPAPTGPAAESLGSVDENMKMIMQHEGVRTRPYKDSLGLWTVGVGHLIGDGKTLPPEMNREFSQAEVMSMFKKDYEHHATAAAKIPGFNKMNSTGKGALIDLTFNMGPKWYTKWPNTVKALSAGDAEGAASGLENSKWYRQVGNRARKIVSMVRAGFSGKPTTTPDAASGNVPTRFAEASTGGGAGGGAGAGSATTSMAQASPSTGGAPITAAPAGGDMVATGRASMTPSLQVASAAPSSGGVVVGGSSTNVINNGGGGQPMGRLPAPVDGEPVVRRVINA